MLQSFLKNLTTLDVIQSFLSLAGAAFSAYIGYLVSIKKTQSDNKILDSQHARTAEQEFRDDLIKQLEDSSARLDRQMQRLDDREKRIADLVKQIDDFWTEKAELKARIATLEAELFAAQRKIKELTAELEKFERKVWYIAPKQSEENK